MSLKALVYSNIEGLGVVKVGTAEFANLTLPKLMPKVWQIASTVAVIINDVALGAFALADDLKVDTPKAITALQDAGINVILMSGDKQSVVDHVAGQLGIEQAYGKMSHAIRPVKLPCCKRLVIKLQWQVMVSTMRQRWQLPMQALPCLKAQMSPSIVRLHA